jgi:GNAT superfamily N-acetyltransferase
MLEIRPASASEPPGSDLLEAMVVEMTQLYGGRIDVPEMPRATPADMAAPGGTFLVVWLDGEPVGCGGVKRLPDGACEIKRMYIAPDVRGRGLAPRLLVALEGAARELGYEIARLDTGPKQPHAQRMYEAAGYRAIGNFNANPVASFWGEKQL